MCHSRTVCIFLQLVIEQILFSITIAKNAKCFSWTSKFQNWNPRFFRHSKDLRLIWKFNFWVLARAIKKFWQKLDTSHIFALFDRTRHFFYHFCQKCKMLLRDIKIPKLKNCRLLNIGARHYKTFIKTGYFASFCNFW